jgi:hypothetical protein
MPVYRFKTNYRDEVEESDGIELESTRQAWKRLRLQPVRYSKISTVR